MPLDQERIAEHLGSELLPAGSRPRHEAQAAEVAGPLDPMLSRTWTPEAIRTERARLLAAKTLAEAGLRVLPGFCPHANVRHWSRGTAEGVSWDQCLDCWEAL